MENRAGACAYIVTYYILGWRRVLLEILEKVTFMTICMIAQAVDSNGEPVLLIRADKRETARAMQARYGKKPKMIDIFYDDVDKTAILSDSIGLAAAGSVEATDYIRDRVLKPLVPALS